MFHLLPLITLALIVLLGLVIALRNFQRITNKLLFSLCLSLSFWIFSVYMADFSPEIDKILIWTKLSIVGPIFAFPILVWFSYVFPEEERSLKLEKIALLFFPAILLLLLVPTSWNVENVWVTEWGTDFSPGHLYWIFSLYSFTYIGLSSYFFFKKYKKSSGLNRFQIKYFFLGAFISALLGLFLNVILPIFEYGRGSVFGPSSSLFLVLFTSYSISRHRLMDIKLAAGKVLVYLFSFIVISLISYFIFLTLRLTSFSLGVKIILVSLSAASLFNPVLYFFESINSKYFYYSFYSSQKTLNEMSKKLTEILEINQLTDLITSKLVSTLRLDRAVILLRDEKTGKFDIARNIGFKEENGICLVEEDNFLVRWFLKNRKTLVYEELSSILKQTTEKKEKAKAQRLKENMVRIEAALCMPLFFQDKITGMVVLGEKISGDPYTRQDIDLLNNLSYQFSVSLENAKLYSEVQDFSKTLEQKVEDQTEKLKHINEELVRSDRGKSEFINMASHQLRTPLTSLKGYVSLLKDGDYGSVSDEAKEKLEVLFNSTERLIGLVNNLLNISRIDLGKLEPKFEKRDIVDLIKSSFMEMKIKGEEKNLSMHLEVPDYPIFLNFDHSQINAVFSELIDNSTKYTPEGSVTVGVKEEEDKVLIYVSDTGAGLKKEEAGKIFSRFTRGEAGITHFTEGTGLGLHIIKRYLDLHNGKIWAESEGRGRGTTFYVELKKEKSD